MNDHDDKTEKALPRAEPDIAFRQAMAGVRTRCAQLTTLIGDHDFEGVEYTARNAADIWLAGRAACRRLIARGKESSPYVDAARRLLEANYIALLELLTRARTTIDVPQMRRALEEVRATLATAMAQPLVDPPETSGAAMKDPSKGA